jgi:hypothetical protein
VHVPPLADLGDHFATSFREFPGIGRFEERSVSRIESAERVQVELLHPAVEIDRRDAIGNMQTGHGRQDADRRGFLTESSLCDRWLCDRSHHSGSRCRSRPASAVREFIAELQEREERERTTSPSQDEVVTAVLSRASNAGRLVARFTAAVADLLSEGRLDFPEIASGGIVLHRDLRTMYEVYDETWPLEGRVSVSRMKAIEEGAADCRRKVLIPAMMNGDSGHRDH